MPSYRFSWDHFDDTTVNALADALGYRARDAQVSGREWLANEAKRPNRRFVQRAKAVIENTWLSSAAGGAFAQRIVRQLLDWHVGPMMVDGKRPETPEQCVTYMRRCRNTRSIQELVAEAMVEFGDKDRTDGDTPDSFVPRSVQLTPGQQAGDRRIPHPYQEEAWRALGRELGGKTNGDLRSGLLVMPTGSGKTYTAARWALTDAVNDGVRVLWVAHRHSLLEQAASAFHSLSALARSPLRVRIVSGHHCSANTINPADNVIVCSVQSLARSRERAAEFASWGPLLVVVDEAHHSTATSYRRLIALLQGRNDARLLGLTATPTRTSEQERPVLAGIFGKEIYRVRSAELVEEGYLARAIPVRVQTNAAIDEGVTDDDIEHLSRFDELSEEWVDRIGRMTRRNDVIIRHYLDHRDRYCKTLVFAVNVAHAALLAQELRDAGVRADYIASYRPDGTATTNAAIVEQFRSGDLDVLVNIEIMTEGVDVPEIDTVFLARPTKSEILIRQMIGRALRGPRVPGGTELAYIVSFEDHWDTLSAWVSPLDLVPDIVGIVLGDEAEPEAKPAPADQAGAEDATALTEVLDAIPWEVVQATATEIRRLSRGREVVLDVFEAIPHGWYVLDAGEDSDAATHIVHVYEHQKPCWEALMDRLTGLPPEALEDTEARALHEEFFSDCDVPAPDQSDIWLLLDHLRATRAKPQYCDYTTRDLADPRAIASEIQGKDLRESEVRALVEERFRHPLAQAVYGGDVVRFRMAVDDARRQLEYPESRKPPKAIPIFDPLPEQQLAAPPEGEDAHDLAALMGEVLRTGAQLLGEVPYDSANVLEWTARLVKGWYGMAYCGAREGQGRIRINRLLNSPAVSPDTIRFLLWHEYLHLYLPGERHSKRFRWYERKWNGYIAADRELDTLNECFGVQYW